MYKLYQKKPVLVAAIPWTGFNMEDIEQFVGDAADFEYCDSAYQVGVAPPTVDLYIKTLEGRMSATKGDFIIRGVRGEFYPCKGDIFRETYECMSEDDISTEELIKRYCD